MRALHIITGLGTGGAENMLARLVPRLAMLGWESEVICLIAPGPIADNLASAGTAVRSLEMPRGVPVPLSLFRLIRWIRAARPNVVHTWLPHADLLGGLATKLSDSIPLVWHLHQSEYSSPKRLSRWTAGACAVLSRWLPTRIVCCGESAREHHSRLGYPPELLLVIPNGFDTKVFQPDAAARASVREELALAGNAPLIGLVARFDSAKDHVNFFRAARSLLNERPETQFLMCGEGITADNQELTRLAEKHQVLRACHLLGRRADMPHLYAALDIATLSSMSEGFPLALGEAMACGVPCVATDVGDSKALVADTGIIVPPQDSDALAAGWRELLDLGEGERRERGSRARCRILEEFSLDQTAIRFAALYDELANSRSKH